MAVRFDAAADSLSRTAAGIVAADANAFTLCGWFKRKVDTGAFATLIYMNIASDPQGSVETWLETDSAGDNILGSENGSGVAESLMTTGQVLTIDTWFFVAYQRTDTARATYWGTESGGTLVKTSNADTRVVTTDADALWIGNDVFTENFNGEAAYCRLWSTNLSDSELDSEWRSTTPVKSANLRGDWRLAAAASAGTDSSGNGLTLTVGGTLTDGGADPTPPTAGFTLTPPTFVAAGTAAFTATASATVTPGLPAGWAADDIHILLAAGSNNTDWPEPSGWTKLSPGEVAENNTAAQRAELWARRAVGGDAAPVLSTYTGTTVRGAQIYGIRGCPTGIPVEEVISVMSRNNKGTTSDALVDFATISPPHPQTRLLALYAYEDDPTAGSTISGWSAFTVATSALGTDMALGSANRTWPSPNTATGTLQTTVSGGTFANSVNIGFVLAFRPIDLSVHPPRPTVVGQAVKRASSW
jgi:hypothetical protein